MNNKILVVAALAFICLPAFASADTLTRQLDITDTGADVSALQTFLAQDGNVYPQKLVTGYFGSLTQSAVSNFQSLNGIATVGRVGPITLAALNAQMNGNTTTTSTTEGAGLVTNVGPTQPVLSNIAVSTGVNSATITWNSNVGATGKVWYSTSWPFNYNTAPSVTSAGYTNAESVTIGNLQANTTYYYVVQSLDPQGNFSWSLGGPTFQTQ